MGLEIKIAHHETPIRYSEVTVFDSREVVYQISTAVPCLGQVNKPLPDLPCL